MSIWSSKTSISQWRKWVYDTMKNAVTGFQPTNNPTFTGTLTVAGGQIAFPATQVASADVNTLDDYEEGTWTPVGTLVTAGDSSQDAQVGTYTKIGSMVSVTGRTRFTKGTGTGDFTITGLPFTASAANLFLPAAWYTDGAGNTGEIIQSHVSANTSVLTPRMTPQSTTGATAMTDSDLGTTVPFAFALTYRI